MSSDSSYREIFDSLNDALFVHDVETGIVVDVNQRVCELYGYTREEMIGRDVSRLSSGISPYSGKEAAQWVRRAVEHGPQTFEWLGRDKSKRLFWVEVVLKRALVGGRDRLLALVRDISARKSIERELAEYRANLERSQTVARIGSWSWNLATDEIVWSRETYRIYGVDESETIRSQRVVELFHPEDREHVREELRRAFDAGRLYSLDHRIVRTDGAVRWVHARGEATYDDAQKPVFAFGVVQDITERKSAEAELANKEDELRQAQKMEAIGRLAGGIAHDFNNLLTAISGFGSLALQQVSEGDPAREALLEILKASERAATLTRQLLAFSRKQLLNPRIVDINALVREMESWLRRLIGENVECLLQLDSTLDSAKVDPNQLEQVVANLVVNARDAMPNGGIVRIETRNVIVDAEPAREVADLPRGRYVMLAVTDNGVGMDASTRAQLFEPFFTTKALGKGTGLGLSSVYGIVKQSGGHIHATSEVGRGSCFRVYLPSVAARAEPAPALAPSEIAPTGNESLLLVEDDPGVRELTRRILVRQGYRVTSACDGVEALERFESAPGEFRLLVTDVVMPRMGGRELARRALEIDPQLSVLFISGYAGSVNDLVDLLERGARHLPKPFAPRDLTTAVREMLDAKRPTAN